MKKVILLISVFLVLSCFTKGEARATDFGGNQDSYNIVIIESNEQVPMANAIPETQFPKIVTVVIAIVALCVLLVTYLINCHIHRDRVRILLKKMNQTSHMGSAIGWNLFQLKKLEEELESLVAESIEIE